MGRFTEMASQIKIGQMLQGRNALYKIISLFCTRPQGPWLATDPNGAKVVIKTAPLTRLNNEIQKLQLCRGHACIRQLVDQIQEPPSVVLEYMDDTVQTLLKRQGLSKPEAKRALKASFEGLVVLHDQNVVHTDIKPDNILVKYHNRSLPHYKLGDLGDSARADVPSNDGEHVIGPAIFRAPEVSLGVPWTTKADIWALGATGITMLTGHYVFNPRDISPKDEARLAWGVLQLQNDYFGPFRPDVFQNLVHETVLPFLKQLEINYRPFSLLSAGLPNIDQEDGDFFNYVMKVDPRQRPTARDILQHAWFYAV